MDDVLLRVPLAISYPGRAHAGKVVNKPVSLIDIPPTILDVIGETDASGMFHGETLYSNDLGPERTFFADFQFIADSLGSVRTGPRKLVVNLEDESVQELDCSGEPCVLMNELRPPAEEEKIRSTQYWEHAAAGEDFTVGDTDRHEIDPDEALKHLRSLGYVK